jgi:hypothetical protein
VRAIRKDDAAMKKLLFQLDTDPIPNTFDTVVAYDGGADHVTVHGGMTPNNVGKMVDGAIFTRPPSAKKNTAIFVTGSHMAVGEAVFNAIRNHFFDEFRVSIMLDSNGSNTTAAAAAAYVLQHTPVKGKRVVILAGTGPVGQRAGVMLAQEGADVVITSRKLERAQAVCTSLEHNFGTRLSAVAAYTNETFNDALKGAQILISTGAAGVKLIAEKQWVWSTDLEVVVDANATPPTGISGIDIHNRGTIRGGKICYGAIGFGALKLEVQRACIKRLFETNDEVLDAPEILALAKTMVGIQ